LDKGHPHLYKNLLRLTAMDKLLLTANIFYGQSLLLLLPAAPLLAFLDKGGGHSRSLVANDCALKCN